MRYKFVSKPNSCKGCPLVGVPLTLKVANLCHKWNPEFEVVYTLDDLGRMVCKVIQKKVEA